MFEVLVCYTLLPFIFFGVKNSVNDEVYENVCNLVYSCIDVFGVLTIMLVLV